MTKHLAKHQLQCPICRKKMWLVGVNAHREAVHSEVTAKEFEQLIIEGIKSGKIKPKYFESPNRNFTSATKKVNDQRKYNKLGVTSIVSGGKTK